MINTLVDSIREEHRKMAHRNRGLDLLRTMAICLVLFLHSSEAVQAPKLFNQLVGPGWSGVDIFFVLSGFLIGGLTFKEQCHHPWKSLKNFWVKRWFRTLPLYFLALFAYVIIKPLLGFAFNSELIWPYFFFLQNFMSPTDFVQSWSLCIEEQFYFVFPWLIYFFAFKKLPSWVWLVPMGVSLYLRYHYIFNLEVSGVAQSAYWVTFPTYTHLDGISLGVFLARTQSVWGGVVKKRGNSFFLLGLSLFLLTLWWVKSHPAGIQAVLSFTLLSLSAGICLMGAYYLKVSKKVFTPIYWLSITSYGLYIWNNLFQRFILKYAASLHWSLGVVLFLLLAFIAAFCTYFLIEKPFMNLRKKFLN